MQIRLTFVHIETGKKRTRLTLLQSLDELIIQWQSWGYTVSAVHRL